MNIDKQKRLLDFVIKFKYDLLKKLRIDIIRIVNYYDENDYNNLHNTFLEFIGLPYVICSKFKQYINLLCNIHNDGHESPFYNTLKKIPKHNTQFIDKVIEFYNKFSFDVQEDNMMFDLMFELNDKCILYDHRGYLLFDFNVKKISHTASKMKYTACYGDVDGQSIVRDDLESDIETIYNFMLELEKEFEMLVDIIKNSG